MTEFREEDHPRDGGKFTARGGAPHVAGAEKSAATPGEHKERAAKARGAAKARRDAAAKARDPATRGEHLARAAAHEERAKAHEHAAEHGGPGPGAHGEGGHKGHEGHEGGLAEWVKSGLEKANEGVERGGERLNEAEARALEARA